jgi:hypothetical protein
MNSYDLSRKWFDFCFENPDKIKPNHTAVYFFAIEHCNRLGWKAKFGFPTTMVMEAIGIKSYNTYINTLTDIVDFGFITMVEKSKNQYSANIIALSNFDKALYKALDKALIKHGTKQIVKQGESIDSINKQETINNKPINKEQGDLFDFLELMNNEVWIEAIAMQNEIQPKKIEDLRNEFINDRKLDGNYKDLDDIRTWFINYVKRNKGTPIKNESREDRQKRILQKVEQLQKERNESRN